MRTLLYILGVQICLFSGYATHGSAAEAADYRVVERGRGYKVIERSLSSAPGQVERYTALANGMNRKDSNGHWLECEPAVLQYPNAIVCTGATYRVIINTNLNSFGAIDLEADQMRMVSHPIGIGFFDPDSGRSFLLARLKDCSAEVISNRVAFRDAFTHENGIKASVVYSYEIGRFHQDVVLEAMPALSPADLSMGNRARLEILTEFVSAPTPIRQLRILKQQANMTSGTIEPEFIDETLIFSEQMRMSVGRAFHTEQVKRRGTDGVTMAKQFVDAADSRRVLVEAVEWRDVQSILETLPKFSAEVQMTNRQASMGRAFPGIARASAEHQAFESRLAQLIRARPAELFALAKAERMPRGLALDYVLQDADSFIFGTGTYYVENEVELTGGTGFYGSPTVIKFAEATSGLTCRDSIEAGGDQLICTAMDDDSVGSIIEGSSGSPVGAAYGYFKIDNWWDSYVDLPDMDLRYLFSALELVASDQELEMDSCTLRHVGYGISVGGSSQTVSIADLHYCNVADQLSYVYDTGSSVLNIGAMHTADCDGDYDNDGLPDGWEIRGFGSLTQSGGGDYDGDSLQNLQEFQLGTDPTVWNPVEGAGGSAGLLVFTPMQ